MFINTCRCDAQHWAEEVPTHTTEDGKARLTIWAGSYRDQKALAPTPNSWATNPAAHVGVYLLVLQPGGRLTLPGVSAAGQAINRAAYFIEGTHLQISGEAVPPFSSATLDATQDAEFVNSSSGGEVSEVLVLQGAPIGEPVAQQGPFVMNTAGEIQEAFADYRRTQFGGWPWPQDAMVFPREQGRFALQQGVKTTPPQK